MKDFDSWNELKKKLEARPIDFYCNRREIWWCSIGLNVGSEEDGKNPSFERPVLILNVFNQGMVRVAPLTSGNQKDDHHVPITFLDKKNAVKISQVRTISTKRLLEKICRLDTLQFDLVIHALKASLN